MEIQNDISVKKLIFHTKENEFRLSDKKNNLLFLVSSGSIAVHPDSSVQLLAEEATLVENLDQK